MSEQRLPTAEETIIDGLIKHRQRQIEENNKVENVKSDLLQQFNSAQTQIINNFYTNVKKEVVKTGGMPTEISADSECRVDLFNYRLNKPQSEIYDIYAGQSKIACQQIKAILNDRGFKIKSVTPHKAEWMKHVEDWDYRDTRYQHGCEFVLGQHKDYFPDI